MRCASAAALALVALGGCGGGSNAVRADLLHGIDVVRTTHDDHRLRRELAGILRRLESDAAEAARDRRAKQLALRGFTLLRSAAGSRIAFVENDSGNLYAAKRDAGRAYHASVRGSALLREAASLYGKTVTISR